MKYYHITDPNNIQGIISSGLKADDEGNIFLFSAWEVSPAGRPDVAVKVADLIAQNQVFLQTFAVIEINPKGIKGEMIKDNVGEITARFQWIVKQKRIAKSYCKVVGIRVIDFDAVKRFNKSFLTPIPPPNTGNPI